MRSTSAMSTPIPTINLPPPFGVRQLAAAFPTAPNKKISGTVPASAVLEYAQSSWDYTCKIVPTTRTPKRDRKLRKRTTVGQTFLSVPSVQSNSEWLEQNAQGIRILQAPALSKLPWLIHGFSTKPGG